MEMAVVLVPRRGQNRVILGFDIRSGASVADIQRDVVARLCHVIGVAALGLNRARRRSPQNQNQNQNVLTCTSRAVTTTSTPKDATACFVVSRFELSASDLGGLCRAGAVLL